MNVYNGSSGIILCILAKNLLKFKLPSGLVKIWKEKDSLDGRGARRNKITDYLKRDYKPELIMNPKISQLNSYANQAIYFFFWNKLILNNSQNIFVKS